MNDITDFFNELLRQYHSVDIADAELKKLIHEDPELRACYRDWCHDVGSSEKNGFLDYCGEYIDSQNSVWDSLNDYDDE